MTLLILVIVYAAAYAAGRTIVRVVAREVFAAAFDPLARVILSTLAGIGALGLFAMIGNAAWILPRTVAVSLIVLLAIAGVCLAWRDRREFTIPDFSFRNPADICGGLALLVTLGLYLWHGWYPQIIDDSFMYHYTVPKQWLIAGHLVRVPYEVHANFYQLHSGWLFWGISLSTDNLLVPRLYQILNIHFLSLFMMLELRRRGLRGIGWIAAAAWPLLRESLETATNDYMDMSQAFFGLAGFVLAQRSFESAGRRALRLLALSGVFLGFAAGMKITGLLLIAVAAAAVAANVVLSSGSRVRAALDWKCWLVPAAILAGAAAVVVMPWSIKNLVITGDPLYPFFLSVFPPKPDFLRPALDFHRFYAELYMTGQSLSGKLAYQWQFLLLYLHNFSYITQNAITLLFSLSALGFLLRKKERNAPTFLYLLGALLVPVVYVSPATRFALGPSSLHYLLLLESAGFLWNFARQRVGRLRPAALPVLVLLFIWRVTAADSRLNSYHHMERTSPRAHFLTTACMTDVLYPTRPLWGMCQFIEATVGRGGRVLVSDNLFINALLDVPILQNPHIHGKNALRIMTEDEGNDLPVLLRRLRGWGVTHLLLNDPLDDQPVLRELKRKHLHPLRTEGDFVFYELVPVESGNAGRE